MFHVKCDDRTEDVGRFIYPKEGFDDYFHISSMTKYGIVENRMVEFGMVENCIVESRILELSIVGFINQVVIYI